MTGFGRGESVSGGRQAAAEIKSVNHRYCEVQMKLPKRYAALEERLRLYLVEALGRGKADLYIKVELEEDAGQEIRIDKALAHKYHDTIRELAETLDIPMNFGVAEMISLPGLLSVEDKAEEAEDAWVFLLKPVDEALSHV
jgi:uncharacterized protein (TIGR00255 family)